MHEPGRRNELTDFNDEHLTALFQELRCPEDVYPRPGFYAKVMDRVEARKTSSIWSVFMEPVFSKRLAFASMALIMLLAAAFVTAIPADDESEIVFYTEDQAAPVLGGSTRVDALRAAPVGRMNADQGRDIVLVDLVSYQEH